LKKLEDIVFKYEKAIKKGLDAFSLPMNHDPEKKLKTYENRIKYIEDKLLWCDKYLDMMQSDLWDQQIKIMRMRNASRSLLTEPCSR
jgi:hypothetical protein